MREEEEETSEAATRDAARWVTAGGKGRKEEVEVEKKKREGEKKMSLAAPLR